MLFGTLYSRTQTNSEISFSNENIQLFYEVHSYKLNHPFDVSKMILKSSKLLNISKERLKVIIHAQSVFSTIKLSKDETSQLSKLKMIMQSEKDKHSIRLNTYLRSKNMCRKVFSKMEIAFLKDKKFQSLLLKHAKTN